MKGTDYYKNLEKQLEEEIELKKEAFRQKIYAEIEASAKKYKAQLKNKNL
ncbi:MAG: hypothetical protein ACTHOM_04870 [Allomuricauda sp.]